jgi:hypothetical protein
MHLLVFYKDIYQNARSHHRKADGCFEVNCYKLIVRRFHHLFLLGPFEVIKPVWKSLSNIEITQLQNGYELVLVLHIAATGERHKTYTKTVKNLYYLITEFNLTLISSV